VARSQTAISNGVISGEAKRKLNTDALNGNPDAAWIPPFILEMADGDLIVCVNLGGIVYYQDAELVDKTLEALLASGATLAAKDHPLQF
jgi:hypothetical protein